MPETIQIQNKHGLFKKTTPLLLGLAKTDKGKKRFRTTLSALKIAAGIGSALVAVDTAWTSIDELNCDCHCIPNPGGLLQCCKNTVCF